MISGKRDRVIFHSKEDMSAGHNLMKAEPLLNDAEIHGSTLNDLLEFYHIKLYFENDLFLLSWTETQREGYKDIIGNKWEATRAFFLQITNENLIEYVASLEYNYKESFWYLLDYFKVYKRISSSQFLETINKFSRQIIYILPLKNIVIQFDREIREFLVGYNEAAELLLARMEEKQRYSKLKYFFPKSLTLSDKENIISTYLESEDANLNYVRLIEKSRDTMDLKLSPKVRLKAKKKSIELNNLILEDGYTWREGIEVAISRDQIEPVKYSRKEHVLEVCYSRQFLDDQKSVTELFNVFSTVFNYTDRDGLITLVSKDVELDVIEGTRMQSKNEYSTGSTFHRKSGLSQMQLLIFRHYLTENGNSTELLIQAYLDSFLVPQFNLNNLRFQFPSKDATSLEKIRLLAPEFDSLLKQFQIFVDEKFLDFELLELDSKPLHFGEIKSLVSKKYVYTKSDRMLILKHKFFSRQSMLYSVERLNSKHQNLYSLLKEEEVCLEDFANFQKTEINKLIDDQYLIIDDRGHVRIHNEIVLILVGDLNRNEVLSYWHYPKFIRDVIDNMVEENQLYFENTLFTKPEQQYFNFYLNKKDFTNGMDLRNKYLHGTNSNSLEGQENDYQILLKLLILILLKIQDDLIINDHFSETVVSQ